MFIRAMVSNGIITPLQNVSVRVPLHSAQKRLSIQYHVIIKRSEFNGVLYIVFYDLYIYLLIFITYSSGRD